MTCSQCRGIELQFDDRVAHKQLERYRRKGPAKTTRVLLEAIDEHGVEGTSFLDVGGGVGALQHELMDRGAVVGTSVDASPAYVESAREEARRRGYADRMTYVEADFVEARDAVGDADFVTLDRVVCCYPDMPALVDASASKARRGYGLVYPRDHALARVAIRLVNFAQWLRRHPFRAYVHPSDAVEARVESHGLKKSFHSRRLVWQVVLFTRPDGDENGDAGERA